VPSLQVCPVQSCQQLHFSPDSQAPLPQQGLMAVLEHVPPLQESLVHGLESLHLLASSTQEPPEQIPHVPLQTAPLFAAECWHVVPTQVSVVHGLWSSQPPGQPLGVGVGAGVGVAVPLGVGFGVGPGVDNPGFTVSVASSGVAVSAFRAS